MSSRDGWASRRVLHSSALMDRVLAPIWAARLVEEQRGQHMAEGPDINVGIIQGRAYRNPEKRITPSGMAIVEVKIASKRYKGRAENRRLELEIVPMTFFGRQGEVVHECVRMGDALTVQYVAAGHERDGKDGRTWINADFIATEVSFVAAENQREDVTRFKDRPREGDHRQEQARDSDWTGTDPRLSERNAGRGGWEGREGGGGAGASPRGLSDDESIPFSPSYI